jgi:hypothetical protein
MSENEIFHQHWDLLFSLATEESRATREEMWEDYIRAFVNDSPTLTRNAFFADWDIARSSFDWQAWREVRGYGRR